jgi:hypothetical protein
MLSDGAKKKAEFIIRALYCVCQVKSAALGPPKVQRCQHHNSNDNLEYT